MKSEFRDMLHAAEWSDKFFNGDWSPSLEMEHYGNSVAADFIVRESAREFLRLFPRCPADEDWLVADFLKRV